LPVVHADAAGVAVACVLLRAQAEVDEGHITLPSITINVMSRGLETPNGRPAAALLQHNRLRLARSAVLGAAVKYLQHGE